MTDPWYLSKRIYAAAILIVATIAGYFSVEIDPETQAVIVDHAVAIALAFSALVSIFLDLWSKYREGK